VGLPTNYESFQVSQTNGRSRPATETTSHVKGKVDSALNELKHNATHTCGEVEVQVHKLLSRHWMEVSDQLDTPAALPPGNLQPLPTGYEADLVREN
jgi:hypothetical protein